MGQQQFRSAIPAPVSLISDHLIRHANELKQTATYNYDSFVESISILNTITQNFSDLNGKKLIFCIKDGTDTTMFWRGLVRIKCHKVNSQTGAIETVRLLNLKQYIHLYNEIINIQAERSVGTSEGLLLDSPVDPPTDQSNACEGGANILNASLIINRLDEERKQSKLKHLVNKKNNNIKEEVTGDDIADDDVHDNDDECVICMDRKAHIILPCFHRYCEECIDEWQDTHHSCPVCRASVSGCDDAWVLSEKPDEQEVDQQTTRSIMQLVDSFPPDYDDPDYSVD